jgi:hypothetical protein
MERIGLYIVEIRDKEGNYRYLRNKNFVTIQCKDMYQWEQQSLSIAIPSDPPFPTPMVLEEPFVSNNAAISTSNFEAYKAVSEISDIETTDGRIRRYKTNEEFEGPLNVLGFILYSGSTPYSAVNMPFALEEYELMYVYYSMLMRW